MKVLRVPVVFSTVTGLPARSSIQAPVGSQVLLRQRRPAFPRRLISWSGLPTSLEVKTQSGRPAPGWMGGERDLVSGSLREGQCERAAVWVGHAPLNLGNADGSDGRLGGAGDGGGGTGEPVGDELLRVVLANSWVGMSAQLGGVRCGNCEASSERSSPLVDMMRKGLCCLVVRSQSYSWSAVELDDGARSDFLDGEGWRGNRWRAHNVSFGFDGKRERESRS